MIKKRVKKRKTLWHVKHVLHVPPVNPCPLSRERSWGIGGLLGVAAELVHMSHDSSSMMGKRESQIVCL